MSNHDKSLFQQLLELLTNHATRNPEHCSRNCNGGTHVYEEMTAVLTKFINADTLVEKERDVFIKNAFTDVVQLLQGLNHTLLDFRREITMDIATLTTKVDNLTADLQISQANETTLINLVGAISTDLAAVKAQLSDAVATAAAIDGIGEKIVAADAQVQANNAKLSAAIAANTPVAAPAPAPAPEPTSETPVTTETPVAAETPVTGNDTVAAQPATDTPVAGDGSTETAI